MKNVTEIERDIRDIQASIGRRLTRQEKRALADYDQGARDGFRETLEYQSRPRGQDRQAELRGQSRLAAKSGSPSYLEGYWAAARRVRSDLEQGVTPRAPERRLFSYAGLGSIRQKLR